MEDGEIVPAVTPSTQEGVGALHTSFHIGYDCMVFSDPFRRLGRKVQMYPLAEHDLTHNRLTHSMKITSMGRSIGNRIGVMLQAGGLLPEGDTPSDISAVVRVACSTHDLGNPPFGHAGEDASRHWFRNPQDGKYLQGLSQTRRDDIQTYEDNAHSLRILASLETYPNGGGMCLASATIGAPLKCPRTTLHESGLKGFNIYQTGLPFIRHVVGELGLIELGTDYWAHHPLSYLMETTDDICYALPDLEDAVELDLLSNAEVENILSELAFIEPTWHTQSGRQRCAVPCSIAIERTIGDVAQTFMIHQFDLLVGCFRDKDLLALCSPVVQNTPGEVGELAHTRTSHRRTRLITETATFPCLGSILDLLVPTAYALIVGKKTDVRKSLALELLKNSKPVLESGSLYQAYMKILDFTGGMVNSAATKMVRDLFGPGICGQLLMLALKVFQIHMFVAFGGKPFKKG